MTSDNLLEFIDRNPNVPPDIAVTIVRLVSDNKLMFATLEIILNRDVDTTIRSTLKRVVRYD